MPLTRRLSRRLLLALALAPALGGALTASAREEVVNVKRTLKSNEALELPQRGVTRVEARVRRVDPKRRETELVLRASGGSAEIAAQVDRQELHTLTWTLDRDEWDAAARVRLTPRNGDVYVETVRVFTDGAEPAPAADRNTVRLNRTLRADEGVDTGLDSRNVTRVEARVRRIHAGQREARLDLNPGGGTVQVDDEALHTVTWTPDPGRDRSGPLRIHARGGEVYIESVKATYGR